MPAFGLQVCPLIANMKETRASISVKQIPAILGKGIKPCIFIQDTSPQQTQDRNGTVQFSAIACTGLLALPVATLQGRLSLSANQQSSNARSFILLLARRSMPNDPGDQQQFWEGSYHQLAAGNSQNLGGHPGHITIGLATAAKTHQSSGRDI